jgi:hypothetical protein
MTDPNTRFDSLLKAMLSGKAPSEQRKPSSGQASNEASPACCDETQTPRDTSEDASD